MALKTIIVEDEPLSLAFLGNLLREFFPEITVVAREATEAGAISAIRELQPDLVFLDIELRTGTGFDVLQQTKDIPFRVIFTTALDHTAINMIRICGVDYLQKPIDISGLKTVIERALQRSPARTRSALDHLVFALEHHYLPTHLLLTPEEYGYIAIAEIISITMKENIALFTMQSGLTVESNKSLGAYEMLLESYSFFRTHQQYLVNTKEIKTLLLQPEPVLVMSDGSRIPLSVKKTADLKLLLDNASQLY